MADVTVALYVPTAYGHAHQLAEIAVTPRPLPEFTIRQPQGKAFSRKGAANRFGGFRQGQGQGRFGGNGNGSGRQDGFMMHDRSGQGGRQPHPHGQRQGKKRPR